MATGGEQFKSFLKFSNEVSEFIIGKRNEEKNVYRIVLSTCWKDIKLDAPITSQYISLHAGLFSVISCHDGESGWRKGHAFFVYTSYIDDKLNFSKFSYGWSRKNRTESWLWENLQEDKTTQSEYAIRIRESVSMGLGAENENIFEHNGFNYNMEVYKHFNKNYNYSYDTNAYIYRDISEEELYKLINYCTDDSRNHWNYIHNCAVMACQAWDVLSLINVHSHESFILQDEISTPKGLYRYLENHGIGAKNYPFALQFQ